LLNHTGSSPIRSKPAREAGGQSVPATKNLPSAEIPPREVGSKILVINKAKNLQRTANQKITKEKNPCN
jgi:hypothetical protein